MRKEGIINMANQSTLQPAPSDPALRSLDRLVGKWQISGPTIEGQVTYEWMEGGFFLIQHVELLHDGRKIKGMEMIGRLRPFGAEPGEHIQSRYYDSHGDTLDYVYEINGETLTIWGGEVGSPAYYQGTFDPSGNTCRGKWIYPGGGYESNMTRAR
jgi:hypothetical protein